ncbi:MAG: RluA family pseudouridine synthase [Ruminococcaceae bacterium]|nr:RluA family pseudouridine synthase [Oscillospiraceae bacterium]
MLDVLYYDNDIAVCVKPAGVLCEDAGEKSLPSLLAEELKMRGVGDFTPLTVHRLDKETSGIMVYALNSKAAAGLSSSLQNGSFEKIYHALCVGIIEKDSDSLRDLLFYDRKRSKSYVVDRKRNGVKEALLDYSIIKRFPDRALVSVKLHTGRTHQIRVQFASRGHALCGDRRYGAPADFGNKLCLCAVSLSFPHPRTNELLHFEIEDELVSL